MGVLNYCGVFIVRKIIYFNYPGCVNYYIYSGALMF